MTQIDDSLWMENIESQIKGTTSVPDPFNLYAFGPNNPTLELILAQ